MGMNLFIKGVHFTIDFAKKLKELTFYKKHVIIFKIKQMYWTTIQRQALRQSCDWVSGTISGELQGYLKARV